MRVRDIELQQGRGTGITEIVQLHLLQCARATRAEEGVQLPDTPQPVAVGVACEDHQPVAAEHEDRQAPERPVDVVLVDTQLVSAAPQQEQA
eukprot:COSAG06_NODE_10435_length_1681_cov_2.834387_2_plen_92_part_00